MKKLAIIALVALVGCTTPFFKSTQGTYTSVGVSLPDEESWHLSLIQYLNGEKVFVKEPSNIKYEFACAETNNYLFGTFTTVSSRQSSIELQPTNTFQNIEATAL